MHALLRRVTPAFLGIAGILWLTVNLRTITDALPTTLLLLAPISLAIAISGLHLHYRMYRTAFYEEFGFVLVLLGSFLTMVAISIQPPTGTETILGELIGTIPWIAATGVLIPGLIAFGIALLVSNIIPRVLSGALAVGLPVEYLLDPIISPLLLGFRPPLFAVVLLALAVTTHKRLSNSTLTGNAVSDSESHVHHHR